MKVQHRSAGIWRIRMSIGPKLRDWEAHVKKVGKGREVEGETGKRKEMLNNST